MGTYAISLVFNTMFLWALCISAAKISPTSLDFTAARRLFGNKAVDISNVQEHLQSLNYRPAVKSIRSSDGDTIDCIPPSEQLAFQHPLLKDHKLQEAPTTAPHQPASHRGRPSRQNNRVPQVWHLNGGCPNGTIPVRRITADDILRMGSGSKFYADPQITGGVEHEHSYGIETGEAYYGTQATFSLWTPHVELDTEFSLAQLWVLAYSLNSSLNTLEAGWQVFPGLYGDNNTRFFVYWTADNYQSTGCYNVLCPGFVQTSSKVLVGGTISPVSSINGSQHEVTLLVFKDSKTGNWWLQFNGEYVGYWPQNLFNVSTDYAVALEWGGEIINNHKNGKHTTTQMGSGDFAKAGYNEGAYIRNLEWVDVQNTIQQVSRLQTMAEKVTCYNITSGRINDTWGTHFFFGGPGQNSNCP